MTIERIHSGVGYLRGKARYAPGKKDVVPETDKETAYWILSGRVEDAFGDSGGTLSEIYEEVTEPLGLTAEDTFRLVKSAEVSGYLKVV